MNANNLVKWLRFVFNDVHADRDGNVAASFIIGSNNNWDGWRQQVVAAAETLDPGADMIALMEVLYACDVTCVATKRGLQRNLHFKVKFPN